MSEVAEAAGAGVASVYRQFASKYELLIDALDSTRRGAPGSGAGTRAGRSPRA